MEASNLFTHGGYFKRHFELCLKAESQEEAYEAVEEELKELQISKGLPIKAKYTSYESFRVCKARYYQQIRE